MVPYDHGVWDFLFFFLHVAFERWHTFVPHFPHGGRAHVQWYFVWSAPSLNVGLVTSTYLIHWVHLLARAPVNSGSGSSKGFIESCKGIAACWKKKYKKLKNYSLPPEPKSEVGATAGSARSTLAPTSSPSCCSINFPKSNFGAWSNFTFRM